MKLGDKIKVEEVSNEIAQKELRVILNRKIKELQEMERAYHHRDKLMKEKDNELEEFEKKIRKEKEEIYLSVHAVDIYDDYGEYDNLYNEIEALKRIIKEG